MPRPLALVKSAVPGLREDVGMKNIFFLKRTWILPFWPSLTVQLLLSCLMCGGGLASSGNLAFFGFSAFLVVGLAVGRRPSLDVRRFLAAGAVRRFVAVARLSSSSSFAGGTAAGRFLAERFDDASRHTYIPCRSTRGWNQ